MQRKTIFYVICLFISGCSTIINNAKVEEGADGIFRLAGEKVPEAALRDSSGNLITDRELAEKTLREFKSDSELLENLHLTNCSYNQLYRANVEQVKAIKSLEISDFQSALQALDEAQKICENIGHLTAQDYLKARAQIGLGKKEEAIASAKVFLSRSSTHNPVLYFQSREGDIFSRFPITLNEFREFRKQAIAFVDGQNNNLELPKSIPDSAWFYPNHFLRPGGSETKEPMVILPQLSSGGVTGTGFGLGIYRQVGKLGLGGSYVTTSDAGSFYNLKVRRSFYESAARDLNIDGSIFGVTNKNISYQKDIVGNYSNVQVRDSSFDPGMTVGATKRFYVPSFGVASEAGVLFNQLEKDTEFFGSLYAFYDLIERGVFAVNAGFVQDIPMVSVSVLHLHLGYNLRDERFDVIVRGFYF